MAEISLVVVISENDSIPSDLIIPQAFTNINFHKRSYVGDGVTLPQLQTPNLTHAIPRSSHVHTYILAPISTSRGTRSVIGQLSHRLHPLPMKLDNQYGNIIT